MIQIKDTPSRNLHKISMEHLDVVRPFISKNAKIRLNYYQSSFIEDNLERIILGTPKELIKINEDYLKIYQGTTLRGNDPKENIESVFNYKTWFSSSKNGFMAYDLAIKLNFNTCPYCNRNYTITAILKNKKRVTRPDFDHFLPQNQYPLLALSFFNLIPSCLICNRSIKNQSPISYGDYIHPYEEGFDDFCKFNYFPKDIDSAIGLGSKYNVSLETNTSDLEKCRRLEGNVKLFQLEKIYEASHTTEISELIRKHHVSNGRYLEELKKSFPQIGSFEELYRLSFGNYFENESLEKRPLSKMTKDIVEQLGFYFPEK